MDLSVDGTEVGTRGGEVRLDRPGNVKVALKVAAWLPPALDDDSGTTSLRENPARARSVSPWERPYWDLGRARIGASRDVPVEIVVNGRPAIRRNVLADGIPRTMELDVPIERSSWVAARILPSSHTNPIFVLVGGQPIRASRRSAQWCLDAVSQCWTQKKVRTTAPDLEAAQKGYEHARQVYGQLLAECARE
jgi:hypothetical protein